MQAAVRINRLATCREWAIGQRRSKRSWRSTCSGFAADRAHMWLTHILRGVEQAMWQTAGPTGSLTGVYWPLHRKCGGIRWQTNGVRSHVMSFVKVMEWRSFDNRQPANYSMLQKYYFSTFVWVWNLVDRLCGPVVRVSGYRSEVSGSIPGATRFSE